MAWKTPPSSSFTSTRLTRTEYSIRTAFLSNVVYPMLSRNVLAPSRRNNAHVSHVSSPTPSFEGLMNEKSTIFFNLNRFRPEFVYVEHSAAGVAFARCSSLWRRAEVGAGLVLLDARHRRRSSFIIHRYVGLAGCTYFKTFRHGLAAVGGGSPAGRVSMQCCHRQRHQKCAHYVPRFDEHGNTHTQNTRLQMCLLGNG